jgi:hypothetical protein
LVDDLPSATPSVFVRRQTLEWVTAAQAKFGLPLDLAGSIGGWQAARARGRGRGLSRMPGGLEAVLILLMLSPVVAQWAAVRL